MSVHVFGIRHHGPGSSRALARALAELRPDILLVEGPPEATAVLPLAAHPGMRPPVALLVYRPDQPRRAAYYPFARFSPEWQAIHYGLRHDVPTRFMDLPLAHQMADPASEELDVAAGDEPGAEADPGEPAVDDTPPATAEADPLADLEARRDPLGWLARAAGEEDGERWWDRMVEQRRDGADLFAAILEAMTALRAALPPEDDPRERQREAAMRQAIRAAQRERCERIAVVCGAWHAPALVEMPAASADAALLKGLPKVKVQATWAPWTDALLTSASGYGAGIESPGWYDHLWAYPVDTHPRWLTRLARLLRESDLDVSSAHIIEATRLAETLAALRGRAQPGLPELTEATQAVLCHGDDAPLRLIHRRLIVGEALGGVPETAPMTPLQQDLRREQRRLRLAPEATDRLIDLDLRSATDLARSHLLHRLALLDVRWGERDLDTTTNSTFHEHWRLAWRPELEVALIEAGVWGNTILDAATGRARDRAERSANLAELTALTGSALLAELPDAIGQVMDRLGAVMAVTGDVVLLMDALPPLAQVARYGSVRGSDAAVVGQVTDGLVTRLCIGLPGACASLDDDAARAMESRVGAVNTAIGLLQQPDHLAAWQNTLRTLADQPGVHGLVAGRCARLLLDASAATAEESAARLSLALSPANPPDRVAAWVEGFLRGSGLLLLHDETLWAILDAWVTDLPADVFTSLLPLLRRSFAAFAAPERRQLGERVRSGPARPATAARQAHDFDMDQADAALPLLARMLGLTLDSKEVVYDRA